MQMRNEEASASGQHASPVAQSPAAWQMTDPFAPGQEPMGIQLLPPPNWHNDADDTQFSGPPQ